MQIEYSTEVGLSDTHKQVIKGLAETALQNFDNDGEIAPISIIINSKDGNMVPVMTLFQNDEEKRVAADFVKKMILETKADAVCTLMESYSIPSECSEEYVAGLKAGKYRRVSDHPEHFEALVVMFENRKGSWTGMIRYKEADRSLKLHAGRNEGVWANLIHLKEILQ